ncbi:hypothetical protein J5N97_028780 [Dioscorea zingiberensis]|uniref:BHLH domain-containing protein n=1 Tax=Dioscorea zingiberensis TaxID=325984 RepID=A0A9D5BZN7_9LILI|nr:hypothetical protein J5N97_028780 [Dioscorea zingiberensis]
MAVGGERSRRGSPPCGTFLEEEVFTEEEMTWFLQYQIDDDCGGGRIGGEGCRFAAPIVDEAGEGEEQRIDVKLGQEMIGEATEKVKMMDPAPIIAAAIVNKAAEEEQRIDVELGQGNPEEKVMDSAPIVDEAAEGEEQRIDMELGQEMAGEASVEVTLMDSREKPAAVAGRWSVIAVEEKAGSSFSPIWKWNQKARRGDEHDPQSEEAELETELRKDTRRQAAQTRRRRAAEVHNLSERKRRDRINEKMKTLQNLVPRCNKTNKASMLNDAIEYLKSLKLHIQRCSTRRIRGRRARPLPCQRVLRLFDNSEEELRFSSKTNPIVAEIFSLMSRDEGRDAGFLNKALSDFNLALDLGFLIMASIFLCLSGWKPLDR